MQNQTKFWATTCKFSEILDKYDGDVAQATLSVIRGVRSLMANSDSHILDSQFISCYLNKREPETVAFSYIDNLIDRCIEDACWQVSDDSIIRSVKSSIKQSCKYSHLIYCYTDNMLPECRTRFRILCRMTWDKLQTELQGEKHGGIC